MHAISSAAPAHVASANSLWPEHFPVVAWVIDSDGDWAAVIIVDGTPTLAYPGDDRYAFMSGPVPE